MIENLFISRSINILKRMKNYKTIMNVGWKEESQKLILHSPKKIVLLFNGSKMIFFKFLLKIQLKYVILRKEQLF